MQPQPPVNEPSCDDAEDHDMDHPLRVVIAYHEANAGKRAMRVMTDLGLGLGGAIEFQPLLWSFELLEATA